MTVADQSAAAEPAESALIERLLASDHAGERVTLVVGSGLGDQSVPRVSAVIAVAERFADGRNDDGDLTEALRQARDALGDRPPPLLYVEYRRVLAGWLSADEFNAIAQQTVLPRYRPPDLLTTALGNHGFWQPLTLRLGEELENDTESWELAPSVRALGALLTRRADLFGGQVLTTNIDPSLEIAVRRAGGRAVSLVTNGVAPRRHLDEDVVAVHHLHGFWRPLLQGPPGRLTEDIDAAAARRIGRAAAGLLTGDLVCVLGSSDRAGTIKATLAAADHRPTVVWGAHRAAGPATTPDLPPGVPLELFGPVDNARLLPELARRFQVPVPSGPTRTTRVRHPAWERLFVSQPDSEPPAAIPGLVRELERRFAWKVEWAESEPLSETQMLVYWPVRLRRRTSVIHMVQAFAAGALAARGAQVVVSLDDLSMADSAVVRPGFVADLRRWITHVAPAAEPRFASLLDFVEDSAGSTAPEALLRPTDPWSVARDFYGRPMSLYTALAAVKALPHLAPYDLEASAAKIVQDLQRHNSGRILTPMTMWAYLHHLLLANPSASLITLGGRDEGLFWEQWRQIYGFGISQLYNPRIKSLTHESGMVRWQTADELTRQLDRLRELPHSHDEGRYIHWLFQNALLLPTYLTRGEVPRVGGHTIDSWAAFATALEEGAPVLETLARHATALYRGPAARN